MRVYTRIAQYGPYYLPLNVFTASNGSNFYIFCLTGVFLLQVIGRPEVSVFGQLTESVSPRFYSSWWLS